MKKNMQALDLDDLDQVSGGIQCYGEYNYGRIHLDSEEEFNKLVAAGLWDTRWGLSHYFGYSQEETYQKIKNSIKQKEVQVPQIQNYLDL